MNVLDTVAAILKLEDVEWVSCFPSNELIEAVARAGIRTIMFRQERGAIMAADGFSRVSNRERFGVVITQGGAGAENSMGGLAQAYADSIPVLYLTAGPALGRYAVRPSFSPVRTYQSVCKHGEVITQPDQVAPAMRRAFHALRNGTPGPVIIEIPGDLDEQEVPATAAPYIPPRRFLQRPTEGDVQAAVRLLLEAKRPMLWSGRGVLYADATAELRELAELTNTPVYATMAGKSSFDERHPLALGSGSLATTLPAWRWLQESDVLFAIGSSMTQTLYGQAIPAGKTIIHNVVGIDDLNKDYDVTIGLPGDTKLTLQMVLAAVKKALGAIGPSSGSQTAATIADLRAQWLEEWQPLLESNETPINTYRVIHELDRTIDKETSIVTHDAGAPRDSIMPFYTATVPHSYIGWGKTTHLGFGIPLMIGAKLAKPDKFCVNFMGDGAFGMSGLDIETAVRSNAPITTVLLNNGGMSTYPGGYPTARERFGVTEMTGNYAKIAEGMGAAGITVTDPAAVAPALARARRLNEEGVTVLLDVHTNLEGRRSSFD